MEEGLINAHGYEVQILKESDEMALPRRLEIPGSTTWSTGSISRQISVFLFKIFLVGFGSRRIISRYAATKVCFSSNITKCCGENVLNNRRKRPSIARTSHLLTSLSKHRAIDTAVLMRCDWYRCLHLSHCQQISAETAFTFCGPCFGVTVRIGFVGMMKPS